MAERTTGAQIVRNLTSFVGNLASKSRTPQVVSNNDSSSQFTVSPQNGPVYVYVNGADSTAHQAQINFQNDGSYRTTQTTTGTLHYSTSTAPLAPNNEGSVYQQFVNLLQAQVAEKDAKICKLQTKLQEISTKTVDCEELTMKNKLLAERVEQQDEEIEQLLRNQEKLETKVKNLEQQNQQDIEKTKSELETSIKADFQKKYQQAAIRAKQNAVQMVELSKTCMLVEQKLAEIKSSTVSIEDKSVSDILQKLNDKLLLDKVFDVLNPNSKGEYETHFFHTHWNQAHEMFEKYFFKSTSQKTDKFKREVEHILEKFRKYANNMLIC